MTENDAIQTDQNGDATARLALCTIGAAECPGREAKRESSEPVFRRHSRDFRQLDGRRLYVCRYCNTNHIFPLDNPA